MKSSKPILFAQVIALIIAALLPASAFAFCGFFVSKADASLYNEASQVVIVREGEKTVLTMANDYKGDLKEFALVVPVPVLLKEGQINVGEQKLIDRLDAFSAPRLVEYFDEDPCRMRRRMAKSMEMGAVSADAAAPMPRSAQNLGVTVEAEYVVGEYDILILSAKESSGLETWLSQNGYKLPKGASKALAPYIRQNLKFFVAKVNLKEQAKTGFENLRPIQMAFESKRFMLPIRLGMLNAQGAQDLIVYTITRKGRVESSNYRTVQIPSNMEIPVYAKNEFSDFYKAMFDTAHARENKSVVFTEYFWNMSWCDPCAANPLTHKELLKLGAFWLRDQVPQNGIQPQPRPIRPRRMAPGAVDALLTRLHVRYDAENFPEDLMFHETTDKRNFQGRYVLRHPWKGDAQCPAAGHYRERLAKSQETRAQTLANLTGWKIEDIRKKMGVAAPPAKKDRPWWDSIFR